MRTRVLANVQQMKRRRRVAVVYWMQTRMTIKESHCGQNLAKIWEWNDLQHASLESGQYAALEWYQRQAPHIAIENNCSWSAPWYQCKEDDVALSEYLTKAESITFWFLKDNSWSVALLPQLTVLARYASGGSPYPCQAAYHHQTDIQPCRKPKMW